MFENIQVTTTLNVDETVDLSFEGVPVDQVDQFLEHLGSEDGRTQLALGFTQSLIKAGFVTEAEANAIWFGEA